jgi:hypothetical protein
MCIGRVCGMLQVLHAPALGALDTSRLLCLHMCTWTHAQVRCARQMLESSPHVRSSVDVLLEATATSGTMQLDTLLDISLQCTQAGNRAHLLHGCTFPGTHRHLLTRTKVKQPMSTLKWQCPCYWVLLPHRQLCGARSIVIAHSSAV